MSDYSRLQLGEKSNNVPLSVAEQVEQDNARKELLDGIDNLVVAIRANKDIQNTADDLVGRGRFKSLTGAISGKNDKELAEMVKNLGGSLETTQIVLQVMLRIQTRKDHLLREFHSVLVDKIIRIQSDTQTLDSNQKTIALEVVSALKDQVEDQLQRYETVDRHEDRLREIDVVLNRATVTEDEFRESIKALDHQVVCLTNMDTHFSQEVDRLRQELGRIDVALRTEVANVDQRWHKVTNDLRDVTNKQADDITAIGASLKEIINTIESSRRDLGSSVGHLSERIDKLVASGDSLEQRVKVLESNLAAMCTWRGYLRQQALGLVSLLVILTMAAVLVFKG